LPIERDLKIDLTTLAFSSGIENFHTGDSPTMLLFKASKVCCGVFSPGADTNQYSAMIYTTMCAKIAKKKQQNCRLFQHKLYKMEVF